MQRLLDFLYQQRELLIFFALEILSFWLLISYNNRYNATFFNTSNSAIATVTQSSNNVEEYFSLAEINEELAKENEALRQQLSSFATEKYAFIDTLDRYQVIGAKVIQNTTNRGRNFLTIAAGTKDSVDVGMGVISRAGVVGQVKSVSDNFATVYSLLHPKLLVSSRIRRTGTQATVQWNQSNPNVAELKYVPRHIHLEKGDTIETSGYNAVFPDAVLVGIVDEVRLEEHMTFYDATVSLATDFSSLYHVYVVKDLMKPEIDSLQAE